MFNFNQDTIKGKWKEIKGEVRNMWGNITDDDLEKTRGNMEAISGLIQQKYGIKREEVDKKLSAMGDRFDLQGKMANKSESLKESLKRDSSGTKTTH